MLEIESSTFLTRVGISLLSLSVDSQSDSLSEESLLTRFIKPGISSASSSFSINLFILAGL